MKKIVSVTASIALMALIIGGFAVGTNHTALADSYKQEFSASSANSQSNGVLNVAGDESHIDYTLAADTSATLSCVAGSGPNVGSMITVATLGGSGTLTASDVQSVGQNCSPNIFTLSHLIQAMREGKIFFTSNGLNAQVSAGAPVMTTPTTPVATSTSATSTTPTNPVDTSTSTASTTAPTAMTSAADLRVLLNNLLREHVASSIDVLHHIATDATTTATSSALNGSLQEQDANAVDLAAAIGSVYGTPAGNQFLTLFRNHIIDSNAYTMGLKNGSLTDQQAALAALDQQLQNLSSFLATANPNIDYATLLAALRQHEALINQSSADYVAGDYAGAYSVERQALAQISGGADYLSNAIIVQYPALFK